MNLNQFQLKVKRWKKNYPKAVNKAIRGLLKSVKKEVVEEYSGKTIGVKTGKTRKMIKYSYKSRAMSARVFIDKPRAFIGRFFETGTVKMRARPVFGPLRKKYTPKASKEILKKLMAEYRASG